MAGPMSLDRLFQSERLVYRTATNDEDEKQLMRDLMLGDSATYALSTSRLLSPPRAEDVDRDMSSNNNALLSTVICLRSAEPGSEPRMVGWVSLDCPVSHRHHRTANLGILIATEHQGKGYGSEAIGWALDWGFAVAGLHAVRLTTFSYNERAVGLYERLGFVREGTQREALYWNRQWHDRIFFSMLEGEWVALRQTGS